MTSSETEWLRVPSDLELCKKDNWTRKERNRYSALQITFLIHKHLGDENVSGRPLQRLTIPPGATYEFSRTDLIVQEYKTSIQEQLRSTVEKKHIDKIEGRLSTKIQASPINLSGELESTISSYIEQQLVKSVQKDLTHTETCSVTFSEETTNRLNLSSDPVGNSRTITLYAEYWPSNWDLYIYCVEFLEFTYTERWTTFLGFPSYAREDPQHHFIVLRHPVSRLVSYKPQSAFSSEEGKYVPEVKKPERVIVAPLSDKCPSNGGGGGIGLIKLAEFAFPLNDKERRKAEKLVEEIKVAAERLAPKRPAAKKARVKRAKTAKVAPKRPAAKKAKVKRAKTARVAPKRPAAKKAKVKRAKTAKVAPKRPVAKKKAAVKQTSAKKTSAVRRPTEKKAAVRGLAGRR